MGAGNLPWAHDECIDSLLLGVNPLGEPMLNGLSGSVNGIGEIELIAKIHELQFRNVKNVGKCSGYCH